MRPPSAWLALGVAVQIGLAAAGAATGERFLLAGGIFLLVPLALTVRAPWKEVTVSAALALVLVLSAFLWDRDATTEQLVTRLAIVGIGAPLIALGARARDELARARGEVRDAWVWLDGVLGSLAEAVTVQDEHGRTVYANDAAARLLQVPSPDDVRSAAPGELAARFSIATEDGSPVPLDELPGRRLLLTGEPVAPLLTRTVDRETGRAYWLLTKASLLRNGSGRYAVNVIEDVTDAKEAERRQRFLDQAGQLLAGSLDYERTLERVAELAVPTLADWCAVDVVDEHGELQQVALAHTDQERVELGREIRRRWPPSAEGPLAAIAHGSRAALHSPLTEETLAATVKDPEHLAALRAIGMRAVMIVPMRAGEHTLGAISFASADSGRTFDQDDLAFAQDLALRAGTAVQNARLYADQARVAHTLQASLLPERLPELPGWQRSAAYHPGEEGAQVGGDFYDIVATAAGHLVFLGDVTGKGIDAAALTALVRHSMRIAARFDYRPAAILRLLNDVLLEQPHVAPVTLACALIAAGTGEGVSVTVSSAGHPRPLLKRDRDVREVGRHGTLLGALARGTWHEDKLELEPGDALVFYTDGVTDMPGAGERFGPERLAEVVAAAPAEPALLLTDVERTLRRFQAGASVDDRAMLVLRYVGDRAVAGGRERLAGAVGG